MGPTYKVEINLPLPCLAQHRDSCAPASTSPVKGQKGAHPENRRVTQRLSLSGTFDSPQPESTTSRFLAVLYHHTWTSHLPGQIRLAAVGVRHLLVLNTQPKHVATGCYRQWEALLFRSPKRFLFKMKFSSVQRVWGKKDALWSLQESLKSVL